MTVGTTPSSTTTATTASTAEVDALLRDYHDARRREDQWRIPQLLLAFATPLVALMSVVFVLMNNGTNAMITGAIAIVTGTAAALIAVEVWRWHRTAIGIASRSHRLHGRLGAPAQGSALELRADAANALRRSRHDDETASVSHATDVFAPTASMSSSMASQVASHDIPESRSSTGLSCRGLARASSTSRMKDETSPAIRTMSRSP